MTLLNGEYPLSDFVQKDFSKLRTKCAHITIYGNTKDGALRWAEICNDPWRWGADREKAVGRAVFDPMLRRLDVDVIDTTSLQNNVHKTKHSYYNINRELVEDLRDLIVTLRRARERVRLRRVHKGSNVYRFMVAPPTMSQG